MRETKFRGMDVNGKWYYGNITILKQDIDSSRKAGCYISNSAGMPFAYNVRPDSVGQFTGLHDKNGKEIYEGDILHTNESDWIAKVIWNYDGFMLTGLNNTGFSCSPDYVKCEVIGNINENMELVNG